MTVDNSRTPFQTHKMAEENEDGCYRICLLPACSCIFPWEHFYAEPDMSTTPLCERVCMECVGSTGFNIVNIWNCYGCFGLLRVTSAP